MPKEVLLDKLANLAVQIGANVQKDQIVVVNAPTQAAEIARKVVKNAYEAGAKKVIVNWRDLTFAVEYQKNGLYGLFSPFSPL
jgi:leucyl aminopeptidase (aminopeptidase T)